MGVRGPPSHRTTRMAPFPHVSADPRPVRGRTCSGTCGWAQRPSRPSTSSPRSPARAFLKAGGTPTLWGGGDQPGCKLQATAILSGRLGLDPRLPKSNQIKGEGVNSLNMKRYILVDISRTSVWGGGLCFRGSFQFGEKACLKIQPKFNDFKRTQIFSDNFRFEKQFKEFAIPQIFPGLGELPSQCGGGGLYIWAKFEGPQGGFIFAREFARFRGGLYHIYHFGGWYIIWGG